MTDLRLSLALRLSGALLVVAGIAGAVTLLAPSVLRDPAGYAGNAIGTYLVILVVALPVTAVAMRAAARGSLAARFVWLGGLGYLLYNAILSSFSVQFNVLFPAYVASLSLGVASVVAVVRSMDVDALPARFASRLPVRAIATYLLATAIAFAAVWLRDALPAMIAGARPLSLRGTTLPVNAVQVIDFAFTLPLCVAAGLRLWRRRPWGYLIGGTMLVSLTIESVSIAMDQYVGHRLDPSQPLGTVAPFIVLAAIGAVPMFAFLAGIVGPGAAADAAGVERG